MLPDLKTGITFPIFHSSGMVPVESDCENNKHRIAAEMCFVFFSSLELMSSMPADEDNLIFSITDESPTAVNVMAVMLHCIFVVGGAGSVPISLVKTDENALLNMLAQLRSVTGSPKSLVRVFTRVCSGFITCQNFLGLVTKIFRRS